MAGDLEHMKGVDPSPFIAGADEGIRVIALGLAGRREEALQALVRMRRANIPAFQSWTEFLMAWLEKRTPDMLRRMTTLDGLKIRDDPEAIFQEGRFFCDVGEHRKGLDLVTRAVSRGYWVCANASTQPRVRRAARRSRISSRHRRGRRGTRASFSRFPGRRRRTLARTAGGIRVAQLTRWIMKTMARPADKAEIVRRLKTVRPDCTRQWGRMSAHQMVCHLSDAFRLVTHQKAASPATGIVQSTLIKWIALYMPFSGRREFRRGRRWIRRSRERSRATSPRTSQTSNHWWSASPL